MLKEWFSGSSSTASTGSTPANGATPAPAGDKAAAATPATPAKSERSERRRPRGPRGGPSDPTFESMDRDINKLFLDTHRGEAGEYLHEGLVVALTRQAHNMQVGTKYTMAGGGEGGRGGPQGGGSGWECSLQCHGFSDLTAATYSSLGRYSLMHQRMFRAGGVGVVQFMAQPAAAAMGGPPGTVFVMVGYPWKVAPEHGWYKGIPLVGPMVHRALNGSDATSESSEETGDHHRHHASALFSMHGNTQLSYVKGQNVQLQHASRVLRGVFLGSQMTYDVTTKSTSTVFGVHIVSPDRTAQYYANVNPESGEWKISMLKKDWASDLEMAISLDVSEKPPMPGAGKGGPKFIPSLQLGLKKGLIGGGSLSAALQSFRRLKAVWEFPLGGDKPGWNQIKVAYGIQYDIMSGSAKHGLTLTY